MFKPDSGHDDHGVKIYSFKSHRVCSNWSMKKMVKVKNGVSNPIGYVQTDFCKFFLFYLVVSNPIGYVQTTKRMMEILQKMRFQIP